MQINEYINKKKELYDHFLCFIDDENDGEENYQNLTNIFQTQKINESKEDLTDLFRLILKISEHHHRHPTFFERIERILTYFENDIKQTFSNSEIFDIFKNCKRILLFLFTKKLIVPDEVITEHILEKRDKNGTKYCHFFKPEIKLFVNEETLQKIENETTMESQETPEEFEKKRQKGENDSIICELIRNDSIEKFVSYVKQNNFPIQNKIKPSIFETNAYLTKYDANLIEYAAFFGSIKIFQYLKENEIELKPSLWPYAIHGRNVELIRLLVENKIVPTDPSYSSCLEESIKCHHNKIAKYIQNNLLVKNENERNFYENETAYGFHYHNYQFMPNDINDDFTFYYLCHFNYLDLVKICLKEKEIDLNKKIISNYNDQMKFKSFFFIHIVLISLLMMVNSIEVIYFLLSQEGIEIEAEAFKGCQKLIHITIPPNVTSIGKYAFQDCTSLVQVEIPNTVKTIGISIFENCKNLKEVTLSPLIVTIELNAFKKCTSLTKITIPSSVKEIGSYAFYGCSNLKEIELSSSLVKIGSYVFSGCSSLTKISIPAEVAEIGSYAFNKCLKLESVEIPNRVREIEPYTFDGCISLRQIFIPATVYSIGNYSFNGCCKLEHIEIPSSVTVIGSNAFYGCSELTLLLIPSSVNEIGAYAFNRCSKLQKITIPRSVSSIGQAAFMGISSQAEVEIPAGLYNLSNGVFDQSTKIKKVEYNDKKECLVC